MIQENNSGERQARRLVKSRCALILLVIALASLVASAWLVQRAIESPLPIPPPSGFVALGIAVLALVLDCRRA